MNGKFFLFVVEFSAISFLFPFCVVFAFLSKILQKWQKKRGEHFSVLSIERKIDKLKICEIGRKRNRPSSRRFMIYEFEICSGFHCIARYFLWRRLDIFKVLQCLTEIDYGQTCTRGKFHVYAFFFLYFLIKITKNIFCYLQHSIKSR